jgi:signal transduction histidine kinase
MNRLPHLRMRLAVRAFWLTVLALALIVSLGWIAADRIIERRIDTAAEDFLQTLVGELEIAGTPEDASVSAPIIRPGEDRIAQIVDLDTGEVVLASIGYSDAPLIESEGFSNGAVVTGEIDDPIDGVGRMTVKAAVPELDGTAYGVVVGVSGNTLTLASWTTLLIVIVAAGVAVGVGTVVWFSVRSAFRPVEALSIHADRIASSTDDSSWQLPVEATTSEIQHLIERLNSLLGRVHASRMHERVFLEDASHDLRTPIAVARAELDLARASTLEPATRIALESAIEELDRLDRLSADLLILAKMRAGPSRTTEQVHLGRLVRTTAARLTRDPGARDITVTVSGAGTGLGDPVTLERAVSNVLRNAMRHAAAVVEISIEETTDRCVIRIHDDGAGFPAELLDSATERFARYDERGEGTGLGLSIASAIMTAHGGELVLENAADGGAVVMMSIPVATQRATDSALH